ncbi:MAG: MATE family efflux transporter [Myxococcota bacterium]|nr:MATE family efflux transporter [Myxococcota bacterium]
MDPTPASDPQPMARRLFRLAVPLVGLGLLNVLTLVVDTAMCARLPNAEAALAGLGFAGELVLTMMVAMIGLSIGAVALVSRAHGASDRERASHVLNQATWFTLILGLLTAGLGNFLVEPLLQLLGAKEDVLVQGANYLGPLVTLSVFSFLVLLYGGILRGVGNTRLPFAVGLVTNVLNLTLNFPLILGAWGFPAMGVTGAAIATVVSQAVGVILLGALLRRGRAGEGWDNVEGMKLSLRPKGLDRSLAGELLSVGGPAALDRVVVNLGFLSVVGMLGHLEEISVAAHTIGIRIQSLAFVPGGAIAMAAAALVGQELGAGRVEGARAAVRAAMAGSLVVMTILGLAFVAGTDPVLSLFDVAPDSILGERTSDWIRILGFTMPLFGIHIALVGMLQGSGSTRTSLAINLIGTLCVQLPAGYVMGFWMGMGPLGVWLSFPAAYFVRTGLEAAVYWRGSWARTGIHA